MRRQVHDDMGLRVSWKHLALACLSGVLLIPGFPKFDLGVFVWVALIPLLVALERKRPVAAFLLSFTTGLIFFPGIFHWMLSVKGYNLLDHAILALYLSSYFGLFGLALTWIRKGTDLPMVVAAPPLWVTLEYLRAHASFLAFPWMLLGHSQYLHPTLVQITSLTGVYGLSFLVMLTNALGADALRHWRHLRSLPHRPLSLPRSLVYSSTIILVLLISTHTYGRLVLSTPLNGERIRIALVQGNVSAGEWSNRKKILDRYTTLTREAVRHAPVLIVWPETAVPGDIKHERALASKISLLAVETKSFLLVGSSQYAKLSDRDLQQRDSLRDPQNKFYNSLFLISPKGTFEGEYRKIALVPFGEYEPLKGIITWPKAIVSAAGRMVPGDSYTLLPIDGRQFGAVICWETIFPELFREFVKRGALFMINATNENWAGETTGPYQLLAITTFRAAENRISIARADNAGVSAFIDPFGRITDRVRDAAGRDLFVEGILSQDIRGSRAGTLYTNFGDLFAFLQIAISAVLLACCWLPAMFEIRSP